MNATENISDILTNLLPPNLSDSILPAITNTREFNYFLTLWSKMQKNNRNAAYGYDLFAGYYFFKIALRLPREEDARDYYQFALEYYGRFLKSANQDKDSRYFIQWQMGLIQDRLDGDWKEVKSLLLKASKTHAGRGEAMLYIIKHYVGLQDWDMAYKFSLPARKRYHGKQPVNCQWFTDPELYDWKILNLHASICFHMGNVTEAESVLGGVRPCM
ncbi:MAG TPA: hypothetical protein VNS58_27245 [Puia sp.]|nr:hypothetical protein [Puia sp.]